MRGSMDTAHTAIRAVTGRNDAAEPADPDAEKRSNDEFADLAHQMDQLVDEMRRYRNRFAAAVDDAHPHLRSSAENLLHYLALRRFDLRNLQESLAQWGLSSLGRTEAHVLGTITGVAKILHRLAGDGPRDIQPIDFGKSREHLAAHAAELFGPRPSGRAVRIIVTLPSEAADDYSLVRDIIAAGADVVRINCAHDDKTAWARMVDHVRMAEEETASASCMILMDLAGAKPRTGRMMPGPEVIKWKPRRNEIGQATVPARIWLAPQGERPPDQASADVSIPVPETWLRYVHLRDEIRLRDARGKKRVLKVVERWGTGVIAESNDTAYVVSGMRVRLVPGDGRKATISKTEIGRLPAIEIPIVLKRGDALILYAGDDPGRPAVVGPDGNISPARISCTLPDVFIHVSVGEPVKLDDGKIEGRIRAVSDESIDVEITVAAEEGSRLRADRGVNFPESDLHSHGLTQKDLDDLDFIVRHADAVGLSFAEDADTVSTLQEELAERRADGMGIVLKIETQRGFRRLPSLLLAAMRSYPVGVMIARGDLAVECGWERTAEVQEEILWLCEAAHVPVIWATQVLEGLTKKGIPSRAEITDAAMAERADCVMLNKGPFIVRAIRTLDDVLKRMEGHQSKKTALLRSLRVSDLVDSGV